MATGDNPLAVSWRDTAWIPLLNQTNVMDYFSERSNLFYDQKCNNELVKMQRLGPEQLANMTGVEYCLLHVQEPILYVIRKQHRHSPTQDTSYCGMSFGPWHVAFCYFNRSYLRIVKHVYIKTAVCMFSPDMDSYDRNDKDALYTATPLADYYIIAGTVYQAPDLCSVVNSRMLNCMHHLQSAFDEAQSFSRYHPSRGYWWSFKDAENAEGADKDKKKRRKEEPSSHFQRQRVDVLLGELAKKFPPKIVSAPPVDKPKEEVVVKQEIKPEVKVEPQQETVRPTPPPAAATPASHKPPPEKKPKLMR